jgi:acylphosphatase
MGAVNSRSEKVARTIYFCAHGRVQGVGFRAFVESSARQLAVEGWVRNRRDETVEGVLKGQPNDLTILIEQLRQGPPGASVASVDVHDINDDVGKGFAIRPTV